MGEFMKNVVLKTGSYFILIFGVILSALVLAFCIYILSSTSGGMEKKGIVTIGCLALALIILFVTIVFFETIRGIVKIEDKIEKLEEK
jgi:hypothetical protein